MSGVIEDGLTHVVAMVEPGARLLRAWTLPGGLSATMTAIEVERPDGARRRLVVRRPRTSRSHAASMSLADEFGLLVRLRSLGLPVPQAHCVDDSGSILQQPYIVLDYVEGSPRFSAPDPVATARIYATQLAAIHEVDGSRSEFADLPRRVEAIVRTLADAKEHLDHSLGEGLIREVLSARWPPPRPDRLSLLHGDFWPGNLIWAEEEVVAVIDWEDASVGDCLADVGIARLDLLWAFGPSAMSAFTDAYFSLRPVDSAGLPVWDLVAALRPAGALSSWAADWVAFGRPDVTSETMRAAHQWFLTRALTRYAADGSRRGHRGWTPRTAPGR